MASRSTNPSLKPEKGISHIKTFKVAGVTFENRQKNLAKLLKQKLNGNIINVATVQGSYNGEPTIDITANGLSVGKFHKEDCDYILANQDRIIGITDLYINDFTDENGKKTYYAKISLLIKNKNTTTMRVAVEEKHAPQQPQESVHDSQKPEKKSFFKRLFGK